MRTELYWIDGPWPGRLAIMPRPRGEDWLEDEILALQQSGIDVVVSTLTKEEETELGLGGEKEACVSNGVDYISFPILDRHVPLSTQATAELVSQLESQLAKGKQVAIHCRQGIGRSSLLAACLLATGGVEPAVSFERIRASRGCGVPDTTEQSDWVIRFAHHLARASGKKG